MYGNIIRFLSSDGIQLVGYYRCPPNAKGVVVHVHGTGGNFYEHPFIYEVADNLWDLGWGILAFNNRGAGRQSQFRRKDDKSKGSIWGVFEGGCAHENYDDCILDIQAAVDFVCSNGVSNIVLQGHSLGGCKVVTYLDEKSDDKVKGLILLSPCDIRGPSVLDKDKYDEYVNVAQQMLASGEGNRLLAESAYPFPVDAKTYLSLVGPNARALIFSFSEDRYLSGPLANISIPILLTFGTNSEFALRNLGEKREEVCEAIEWFKKRAIKSPCIISEIIDGAPHNYFLYESSIATKIVSFIREINL